MSPMRAEIVSRTEPSQFDDEFKDRYFRSELVLERRMEGSSGQAPGQDETREIALNYLFLKPNQHRMTPHHSF